jgi:hypothetical protein
MPNLQHITVVCDGQPYDQRRSTVDSALISLRIALEQTPLKKLERLSLVPVHSYGPLYLRPVTGFGTSPVSRRRWHQIQALSIHIDAYADELHHSTDRLKILHSYLVEFPNLRTFTFHWRSTHGPYPLSLERLESKMLRYIELENVKLRSSEVSAFRKKHQDYEHTGSFSVDASYTEEEAKYTGEGATECGFETARNAMSNKLCIMSKRDKGKNSSLFKDVRQLLKRT